MKNFIMNALKKFLAVSPVVLALTAWGLPAFAATTITSPVTTMSGVENVLCTLIGWFIWIVIIISVLMVVYAAYTYVTAGDDTEKVAKGRKTITYAAIGILVAILAAGVPNIVATFLGTTLGGFAGVPVCFL